MTTDRNSEPGQIDALTAFDEAMDRIGAKKVSPETQAMLSGMRGALGDDIALPPLTEQEARTIALDHAVHMYLAELLQDGSPRAFAPAREILSDAKAFEDHLLGKPGVTQ